MITGSDFVAAAQMYAGTQYILGAEHDTTPGFVAAVALDCSELVTAALGDLGLTEAPDGHWNQWRWCNDAGLLVPLTEAIDTPGALLFFYDGTTTGHVAISRGDGTTIEARGRMWGTGNWSAWGRTWSHGARVPGLDYEEDHPMAGMTDDEMRRLAGFIAEAIDARPRTVYSYSEGVEKNTDAATLACWHQMESQLIRKAVQQG